ncbi:dienelactone hydrolase family protein [Pseudonocardia yunnanensis]|uniref:Dienelactone hydrolase family protein n=1 Tax=Pseudonocardia yunnanensis TaxID=58107 RepID=A0ABW4EZ79_9PSEU
MNKCFSDSPTVTATPVVYRDDDVVLDGVVMRDPATAEPRPGVLVVHGGAGLDDHARGRARRFAELGYVVLAADMYGRGVRGDRQRIMEQLAAFRADPGLLARRTRAALDVLATTPGVEGPLAAVGYCFGGMSVLELARAGSSVAGVISVHGSLLSNRPAPPGTVRTKILVCHGGSDPHIPWADVDGFAEEMTAAQADWQLTVYGGALHGFTHDGDTGQTPGVAYSETADARSWTAIRSFLTEIFDGEGAPVAGGISRCGSFDAG